MKFADLAPNETVADALFSAMLIARPWMWKREIDKKLYDVLGSLFPGFRFVFFLSGRSALFHLLQSLNLKNASIMLTGFTCSAVVTPVLRSGMFPLYADIETETWGIDMNDLKKKWRSDTKAVIIQHTFGITPKHRGQIIAFARQRGAVVIEDLAHGFDTALYGNEAKIRREKSDYILTSFGRSKWISSVFGAALGHASSVPIVIPEPQKGPNFFFLFRLLLFKPMIVVVKSTYHFFYFGRILYALIRRTGLLLSELTRDEITGKWNDELDRRFPRVCGELLLKQFETFSDRQKSQSTTAQLYNELFNRKTPSFTTVSPRYPVLVKNKDDTIKRLSSIGVRAGRWYTQPIAPQGYPLEVAHYRKGDCPRSEYACKHLVTLPLAVNSVTAREIASRVDAITISAQIGKKIL